MKISLLGFLLITVLSQGNYCLYNRDKSVGYVKESRFYISDSIKLKAKFLRVVNINDIYISEINKLEIKEVKTLGNKENVEYLLIGYNYKTKMTIARCLRKKRDLFFLEEDLKKPSRRDDFYSSYFMCYTSENDCFPYVSVIDDEKRWASNSLLACQDSDCKCLTVLVEYE